MFLGAVIASMPAAAPSGADAMIDPPGVKSPPGRNLARKNRPVPAPLMFAIGFNKSDRSNKNEPHIEGGHRT